MPVRARARNYAKVRRIARKTVVRSAGDDSPRGSPTNGDN